MLNVLESALSVNASAFTTTQMESITTAITSAVGSIVDTFVGVLPVIAVICGVLWGIRFILHQFNKLY